MKTYKTLFILALTTLALSSCSGFKNTYNTSRVISVSQDSQIIPTRTLVDVQPDFTRRITVTTNYFRTQEEALNDAKYRAITENKIDILVDPIYKVEQDKNGFKVTLTGYAGMFTNPRTCLQDIQQYDALTIQQIEKYLMMKENPEILKYMYTDKSGNVITINHDDGAVVKSSPTQKNSSKK